MLKLVRTTSEKRGSASRNEMAWLSKSKNLSSSRKPARGRVQRFSNPPSATVSILTARRTTADVLRLISRATQANASVGIVRTI
jgi:hypothetical protein